MTDSTISYRPLPDQLPEQTTAQWVQQHMLSQTLTLGIVWGEVVEVLEALLQLDGAHALEELIQVWYTLQMWVHGKTGWNFTLKGCRSILRSHFNRFNVWRQIFSIYGVEPSLDYFRDGTNWEKTHKIVKTLARAGVTITSEEVQTNPSLHAIINS